jgi:hypothetical protein
MSGFVAMKARFVCVLRGVQECRGFNPLFVAMAMQNLFCSSHWVPLVKVRIKNDTLGTRSHFANSRTRSQCQAAALTSLSTVLRTSWSHREPAMYWVNATSFGGVRFRGNAEKYVCRQGSCTAGDLNSCPVSIGARVVLASTRTKSHELRSWQNPTSVDNSPIDFERKGPRMKYST